MAWMTESGHLGRDWSDLLDYLIALIPEGGKGGMRDEIASADCGLTCSMKGAADVS